MKFNKRLKESTSPHIKIESIYDDNMTLYTYSDGARLDTYYDNPYQIAPAPIISGSVSQNIPDSVDIYGAEGYFEMMEEKNMDLLTLSGEGVEIKNNINGLLE